MIDRYAVVGDPIEHSLSPVMQAAAFQSAGIAAVYEAHRVGPDMLHPHLSCLRLGYHGFNVTIPHKERVLQDMDELDGVATSLGAVNTVTVREERLIGFNTDPAGFIAAVRSTGFDPAGRAALVFGAGGAARSVVSALLAVGAAVRVSSRTAGRIALLRRRLGDSVRAVGPSDLRDALATADLVVNATPLGQPPHDAQSPLPPGADLQRHALVFDLVYGRDTPLLLEARQRGCATEDGLEMLVQQGAASFQIWTGQTADTDAMRKACRRELEARRCFAS